MKFTEIEISNFRSIEKATLAGGVNDVWTVVGQNNAGKSSVMFAIRAFYGDYNVKNEDFPRNIAQDSEIKICFTFQLTDEEYAQLPGQYKLPNNRLKVVKKYSKDKLRGVTKGFIVKEDGVETESEDEFFGAQNVAVGKLGSVIYIPAVKELSEELKKTKTSLFSRLVSRIITETITDLPAWERLVEDTSQFIKALKSPVKSTGDYKSLHEIEESLASKMQSWGIRPCFTFAEPTPEDIVMSTSGMKLISVSTNNEEDPSNLGSGAQRSLVNNLLMLWAEIENKKQSAKKKNFNGDLVIVLYEEPEAFLHYDQEKKLLRNLEELASNSNTQVLISTHSPNLISTKKNSLRCISRLMKHIDSTSLYSASEDYIQNLLTSSSDFDLALWLNPDRNTMFFVDKVILVEGTSDKAFLNYIIDTQNLSENVYIVDCGMKSNIPTFMKLCAEFGIHHLVMYDEDHNKNAKHQSWNSAITTATNSFTKASKAFVNDLEDYVGFQQVPPADKYKKPYKVLEQLKSGNLTDAHLNEFISFINT